MFVPIAVGLCGASALQMLHFHNTFFAMIMAINGHDQQQKKLAALKHTQGDGRLVLWLIVVSVAIAVVLCVVLSLQTRDV